MDVTSFNQTLDQKGIPGAGQTHTATQSPQPGVVPEAPKADAAPVEPAKKDEDFASRFAALSKKEKAIVRANQQAKAERDALAKEKAEIDLWKKQREESKSNALKNPLKYLEEAGLTYEQLTNSILSGDKPNPELELASVKKEIQKIREEQEAREAAKLEAEKQSLQAQTQETLVQYQAHLDQFLDKNKEKYEFIHAFDVKSLVLPLIEARYEETFKAGTPVILSEQEAADLIEKSMEETVEKLLQTAKFKSKYMKTEEPRKETGGLNSSSTKTLSNSLVSSSAPSMLPAKNEQDRMARALAALEKTKVS